jgi:hypothetical protein
MKLLNLEVGSTRRYLGLGLASLIVLAGNAFTDPSAQVLASATSFACGKSEGKPATVARTKKGDVPIVKWSSDNMSSSGYPPQVRCQQVSARFQTLYKSGQLKYITAGTVNKIPVVCATKEQNSACNSQNLLFTLNANANPQLVIQQLTNLRNKASRQSLNESATFSTSNSSNSVEVDWLEDEN